MAESNMSALATAAMAVVFQWAPWAAVLSMGTTLPIVPAWHAINVPGTFCDENLPKLDGQRLADCRITGNMDVIAGGYSENYVILSLRCEDSFEFGHDACFSARQMSRSLVGMMAAAILISAVRHYKPEAGSRVGDSSAAMASRWFAAAFWATCVVLTVVWMVAIADLRSDNSGFAVGAGFYVLLLPLAKFVVELGIAVMMLFGGDPAKAFGAHMGGYAYAGM